jgi:hypothetical protein
LTYQKLKYIRHAGTTPDSGIPSQITRSADMETCRQACRHSPRKKRAANNPLGPFVAAIQHTIVPNPIMMHGKYLLPLTVFISRFDGISRRVTMKYVIDIDQLNWIP